MQVLHRFVASIPDEQRCDADIAMAVGAIGDLVGGVGAPELLAAVADDQKTCASNVFRPRG